MPFLRVEMAFPSLITPDGGIPESPDTASGCYVDYQIGLLGCIDARRGNRVLLGWHQEHLMDHDLETFRTDVEIENPASPGERRMLKSVPVKTDTALSWLPAEVLDS